MACYQCIPPRGKAQTRSYSPLYSKYHGWFPHSKAFFRRSMGLSNCHTPITAQPPVNSSPSKPQWGFTWLADLKQETATQSASMLEYFFIPLFSKPRVEGHCHISVSCLASSEVSLQIWSSWMQTGTNNSMYIGTGQKWFLETIHWMQIAM